MANDTETLADIGNAAAHAMTLDEAIAHAEDVAGKCDTSCKRDHRQLADWLKELRDVKRTPVGNAAALREALVCLRDAARNFYNQILNSKYSVILDKYTCCKQGFPAVLDLRYAIPRANFALSAPPRNCDIYDEYSIVEAFEKAMDKTPSRTADERDEYMKENWFIFQHWLFATAEKGADE